MFVARLVLCASVAALLADAAPSCGTRRRFPYRPLSAYLRIQAPPCTCSPETVRVTVDSAEQTTVACGASVTVEVAVGRHSVGATAGSRTWEPKDYEFTSGSTTRIDLDCPATSAL